MSEQQKKVVIKNSSFVGFSARSKTGCLCCRKRKKKCDEVHPICGPCEKKGTDCIWREINVKKAKYQFDLKPMMESQQLMRKEKSNDVTKVLSTVNNKVSKPTNVKFTKSISKSTTEKNISIPLSKSNSEKSLKNKNSISDTNKKLSSSSSSNLLLESDNQLQNDIVKIESNGVEIPTTDDIDSAIDGIIDLQPVEVTDPDLSLFKQSINWFGDLPTINNPDINRAVNDVMDDDKAMDSFINNVVEHIKSPAFNPESNFLDLSINSAIKHAKTLILNNKIRRSNQFDNNNNNNNNISTSPLIRSNINPPSVSTFDADQFINIDDNESKLTEITKNEEINTEITPIETNTPTLDDDDIEEYDSNDKYLPMDESQLLENVYQSDTDLINVFKSKKLHPYLKPTVHLLLSKNNSLKIINPSSPIMRQLDSTAKLFLENYVTNLAMNHLDIGTSQFFLDYAISQASHDPAILYCLVAWGGMFLVGRDNDVATVYFDKSLTFIKQKRNKLKKSEFENDKYIEILLFYVLLLCAEISTGDVGRWYHLLLQCKDILNNYGELRHFVQKNKDNKVAKWILSSIFYHDVLCTRTTDLGTVIPMNEYKDVFKTQKFLQNSDYGLDPFYGLSQDLYILLGEVANSKRSLNNAKFPLSLIPVTGLAVELNKKYFKEMEESWFQIFDCQILSCKPLSSMLDIIINNDPDGTLVEHHLTFFELTQICLRIYIRITFKELEFDDQTIQRLWQQGFKLFNILIGTKLQTLLGLSLLMLGVTAITQKDRRLLKDSYDHYLINYQILNVRVCWELIGQVWKQYDTQITNKETKYVDWTQIVNTLGWNCCFT
ncbi:hypothetical protein C6P40_003499 [Pichia californica]|uniref:Zn(2)-C6 fungal-type domain-containing protein n=1 Tax=Pichia californica TaxID=460514 RepID=A0A9P7BIJ7_9ASCO|nr:hypothetical protein C6P42_004761 [[Candida] californica]KAG0691248.1 hypothetical protein C6P40_003499 [[Candida] californica]